MKNTKKSEISYFKEFFKYDLALFLSGAGVMIFELVGSRIIGPYFGTSFIIRTGIIGVILGSLSLGYYLGGKIADKTSNLSLLSYFFLIISLFFVFIFFFKDSILSFLQNNISSLILASIIASLILFMPISTFFGFINPFIATIKVQSLKNTGKAIGDIYAISTVGSIFGTFFAGYFLIPFFGTNNIILSLSFLFLLLSIFFCFNNFKKIKIVLLFFVILSFVFQNSLITKIEAREGIYRYDTSYATVTVRNGFYGDSKIVLMNIDNEFSSAIFADPENKNLVFDYTKYYDLVSHFNSDFDNSLMIGGAGYTYPTYFLQKFPGKKIDVVEIDEKLVEIAKSHFNFVENENLQIFHEDGRTFLNKNTKKYDVIFGDAFKSQYSLPFNLTTVEAYQKMHDSLTDDGMIIINVISAINGEKGEFFRAEYKTIKEVFPYIYAFTPEIKSQNDYEKYSTEVQNIIILASKNPLDITKSSDDSYIQNLLDTYIDLQINLDKPVLTDDYAPVDYYSTKSIL